MDYRTRSETQAVRVCAGILLLIITMILTRLQIDDTASTDPMSARKAKNLGSRWSHVEQCTTNMTSTIHYINTWPTPTIMMYQTFLPDGVPGKAQLELVGLTQQAALGSISAATPQTSFSFVTLASMNDTVLGVTDATSLLHSDNQKVIALASSNWCQGKAADADHEKRRNCLLSISAKVNDPDCLRERYIRARLAAPPDGADNNPCHGLSLIDVNSGISYDPKLHLPIALDANLITFTADTEDIFYISGTGIDLRLNQVGSDGNHQSVKLPLVDEREILKLSYISTLNNRLGNGQQNGSSGIKVTDIPVYRDVDTIDATSKQERAASLPALVVYPSSQRIAVVRAGSNLGVIIQIFHRQNLQFFKSIQFDNMDSAWIIQAPDSTAKNYLILMGSAPPYAWQTEAIDLEAGTVETRHSFM